VPFGYESTNLWLSCLGQAGNDDHYHAARSRLQAAYHSFRERAILLAAEIPQDLREFTQHDASHIDALWEMADLIAGKAISFTPTEGFVLGGAFLIHDLGMGIAALPNGYHQLLQEESWLDIVAISFQDINGETASKSDLLSPPPAVAKRAIETALRERHAARAADLAFTSWQASGRDATYHLIEDVDLRTTYGHLIGQLAASHGWNLDQVASTFPTTQIGAPVDCPPDWTVEPLKLACLMRLSDATQVDARRAPGFLRAIRKPRGDSELHWAFQEHLQRPTAQGERLIYTAARPFEVTEASAWWLCYETLQMIDFELASVDALLMDYSRPRMTIRNVKGADSPHRLNSLIPTVGWTPVDARVTVGNVPKLVRALGGQQLYGDNPEVPLRELIQNASDALRALKHLTQGAPKPTIHVKLRQAEDGAWWLTVTDNGVGMSRTVMSSVLLDFGRSYWGSQLMRQECPGLAASEFRPTGKFGIGFYSVFMLGDEVRVTSRRFDEASADTRVLEFSEGVSTRPILRPARRDERRHNGGTTVAIRLRETPREDGGLLGDIRWHTESLSKFSAYLAPAIDADLVVEEGEGEPEVAVRANDWLTMSGEDLVLRLSTPESNERRYAYHSLSDIGSTLRVIEENGEIVGRAALRSDIYALVSEEGPVISVGGAAVIGGLRAAELGDAVGIFMAVPLKADRSSAAIQASVETLRAWASEQTRLHEDYSLDEPELWLSQVPSFLALLDADPGNTPLGAIRTGFLDAEAIRAWALQRQVITAASFEEIDVKDKSTHVEFWDKYSYQQISPRDDVLIIPEDVSFRTAHWVDSNPDQRWRPRHIGHRYQKISGEEWWYYNQRMVDGMVLRQIVTAWGCALDEAVDQLETYTLQDYVEVADPINPQRDARINARAYWRITRP